MLHAILFVAVMLWASSSWALIEMPVSSLPSSTVAGAARIVIDGVDDADCSVGGGVYRVLCTFDGVSVWTPGGGGVSAPVTLETAKTNNRVVTSATSASPVEIGNGTQAIEVGGDATLGGFIRPKPLGDSIFRCWTNYNCVIRDEEGAAAMFTIDPDATENDKYVWASGYRPIKTLSLPADALYVAGAATLVTDAALISGGLVSPYITITDSNSDYFYRYVRMPPTWDGGTVTATITVVNVNATPANAFEVDVSGECYPAGAALGTTISTTGEQAATITFGSSGSCGGSACNQNDPASATTAAITLNGTPAGGNLCGFQAQVDATATTETVAGIKVIQMDIHYKISKGF